MSNLETPNHGQTIAKEWFDKLEVVLHAEARLAGLLAHGTLVGNAREFFVTRVLRSVLPPSLHVGTGRVIGHDGKPSKQLDVVIYDPNYPVLETYPGNGLYLLEGTIAVIEVKSTLDAKELKKAVDNCYSVNAIPMSHGTAGTPSTYVFAFQSKIQETTNNVPSRGGVVGCQRAHFN